MKAVVAASNQEKALVEAFSVITNLRMDLFEALMTTLPLKLAHPLHDAGQSVVQLGRRQVLGPLKLLGMGREVA